MTGSGPRRSSATNMRPSICNECSRSAWQARNLVITRLAQNVGLKLLAAYDCNPPISTHWSHRLFIEKREAAPPYGKLKNPEAYAALQMNPIDNQANLPATYLEELQALPARERCASGRDSGARSASARCGRSRASRPTGLPSTRISAASSSRSTRAARRATMAATGGHRGCRPWSRRRRLRVGGRQR